MVTIVDIDEGWDVPPASFMVNLRPTRSWVKARQRAGRILRPYDENGHQVTAQLIDIIDIFNPTKMDKINGLVTGSKVITVPQIFGQTEYHAGKVFAATDDRLRRDVTVDMLPKRLRHALTVGSGVEINKLQYFGMTANRERANKDTLTAIDVARGLGVTASRLNVLIAVTNTFLSDGRYFTEEAVTKIEKRLLETDEPFVL